MPAEGTVKAPRQQTVVDKLPDSVGSQSPTAGQLANTQSTTLCYRTCHRYHFLGMIAVVSEDYISRKRFFQSVR